MRKFMKTPLGGALCVVFLIALVAAGTTYRASHTVPNVDNTLDLGTSTLEWRDGYFDGELKTDTLTVDELLALGSDNAVDLGTTSVELKNAYFDGTVKTDQLTVDSTSTFSDSIDVAGESNITRPLAFGITNVTTAGDKVIFTFDRAVRVVRGDLWMGGSVTGGTLGVTLHSGAASMSLATTAATASATVDVEFASGAICTLSTTPGGASTSQHAMVVFQLQDG